ncbi:hypothetical protein D2Q93_00850 [Alicyclobacillaceae bacterium I2511]|nr:hypothetical protein D2Q93_00850 [Alicyclobacillaceae bacterium I2511]
MAISSLNLSSSAPLWCTPKLLIAARHAAQNGLPNEVIGFIYRLHSATQLELRVLPAVASPWQVQALPEAVVSFTYEVLDKGGKVYATFHTHPCGGVTFSLLDSVLATWSQWHLLLLRTKNADWQMVWGLNSESKLI